MDSVIIHALTRVIRRELDSMGVVIVSAALGDVYPITVTGAPLEQTYYSKWAIAGAADAGAVTITGGEYQIGSGAWTDAAGTIAEGDRIRTRLTSSADPETATLLTLTVNGDDYTFSVTTKEICYLLDGEGEFVLDGEGQKIEVPCE